MRPTVLYFALLLSSASSAQDFLAYAKKEYVYEQGKTLPYRILYPENYSKAKKYPLVLVLHGAGERGNNNEAQLTHGAKLFLQPENRKNFPAIVVFPQCPAESFWASIKVDTTKRPYVIGFDYAGPPNWPLAAANSLVRKLIKDENADTSRIYITGLSMGGMGTFESVYRNPHLYAAALPICGGADTTSYQSWKGHTPFWIFHGASDAVVNADLSRSMEKTLKAIDADVTYTEYPGVNHNSWDNAFAEPRFLLWMFQHRKP